jgi:hypothetical protein
MPSDPTVEAHVDAALAELREQMLRELSDGTATHGTLDQIEDAVARLGDEFRRRLQEQIIGERTRTPRENALPCPCGERARYHWTRERVLITRHGELRLARPYYHCPACHHGFTPLDGALGLDGEALTTQLRCWLADLGARLPFPEATQVLADLTGIAVSGSTTARTAVAVGTAVQQAQAQMARQWVQGHRPPVQRKPKRLYLSADGKLVPLREVWKRDGSLGPLVCRWGECKSAVVYETQTDAAGQEEVVHRRYLTSLGDCHQFGPQLAVAAHQSGVAFAREVVFLADGAAWLWQIAAAQFPQAVQILDFYHASQHLYTVAHAQFGEGTAAAKAWVQARQAELLADQVEAVLGAIAAWKPKSRAGKQLRRREFRYFRHNTERLRYGSFRKQGYQIGSGVMEATCKHVVGQRLDQAGMHWRPAAAEAIVALRAALLSTNPPNLRPYCRAAATLPPS